MITTQHSDHGSLQYLTLKKKSRETLELNDITNHIDLTDNDRVYSSQQPWDFLQNQPHIGTQNKTQQYRKT